MHHVYLIREANFDGSGARAASPLAKDFAFSFSFEILAGKVGLAGFRSPTAALAFH
jgi:hypothetical protein